MRLRGFAKAVVEMPAAPLTAAAVCDADPGRAKPPDSDPGATGVEAVNARPDSESRRSRFKSSRNAAALWYRC